LAQVRAAMTAHCAADGWLNGGGRGGARGLTARRRCCARALLCAHATWRRRPGAGRPRTKDQGKGRLAERMTVAERSARSNERSLRSARAQRARIAGRGARASVSDMLPDGQTRPRVRHYTRRAPRAPHDRMAKMSASLTNLALRPWKSTSAPP
jgi:hypothetical protein